MKMNGPENLVPDVDQMMEGVGEVVKKVEEIPKEKVDKIEQAGEKLINQGTKTAMGAIDRFEKSGDKMMGMMDDFLTGEKREKEPVVTETGGQESSVGAGEDMIEEDVTSEGEAAPAYVEEEPQQYQESTYYEPEPSVEVDSGQNEPVAEYEGQKIYKREDSKGDVFYASEDGKTTYIPSEKGGGQVYHGGEKVTTVTPAEEQEAMAYAEENQG